MQPLTSAAISSRYTDICHTHHPRWATKPQFFCRGQQVCPLLRCPARQSGLSWAVLPCPSSALPLSLTSCLLPLSLDSCPLLAQQDGSEGESSD